MILVYSIYKYSNCGYCYLVSHLADQTPAPSQRLFNLLRTWSDVLTFLHRGVLIVTASSHVIRWLCRTTRKARNSETMKHIFAGTVYIQVYNCAYIIYIYMHIIIYIYYIYICIYLSTHTNARLAPYGPLLPKERACALPNHPGRRSCAWSRRLELHPSGWICLVTRKNKRWTASSQLFIRNSNFKKNTNNVSFASTKNYHKCGKHITSIVPRSRSTSSDL